MKTIWKFDVKSSCEIQMPEDSVILSVGNQYNTIQMWAQVDDSKPSVKRRFFVYGTGHALPEMPLQYVGTAQLYDGSLVFHVFEGVGQ